MLRPQGYAVTREPGKADVEEDTVTCRHCGKIIFLSPGHIVTEVSKCLRCDKYVCPAGQCSVVFNDETGRVETGSCDPLEEKFDRMESSERFRRSVG